ncbi:MAG: methylated-DNA--[protein]-cysteine S-methyltransferase [Planctomycetaceae bacterium]
MFYTWMNDTPIGRLLIAGEQLALKYVLFDNGPGRDRNRQPRPDWEENAAMLQEPVRQLNAYFRGQLRHFDLPLAADGTEFQKQVWSALSAIPFGETTSYGEIARAIGRSQASRAVGMANGRNPISIVVPCHRVIGSSGKLVGYGGGLDRKTTLLRLEGVAV